MRNNIIKATIRALLGLCLFLLPIVLFRETSPLSVHEVRASVFIALLVSLFLFWEYSGVNASIIEFRAAPPYNKIRFATLFILVLVTCLADPNVLEASWVSRSISTFSASVGSWISHAFSPFQYALISLERVYPNLDPIVIRHSVSAALSIALIFIALSYMFIRFSQWSRHIDHANLWKNFPIFGRHIERNDVRAVLRIARINFWFGLAVLLWGPKFVEISFHVMSVPSTVTSHSFIWIVTLWIYLFVNFLMRSFALFRFANAMRGTVSRLPSSAAV